MGSTANLSGPTTALMDMTRELATPSPGMPPASPRSGASRSAAPRRLRLLRALHAQPHRYPRLRWVGQSVTFLVLYGAPLLGLARFDLWDGRHFAAGRPAGLVYGLGALFIGVFSFYIITFVLNAALGRIFCGFGCPIGQASRLGDDVEAALATGHQRLAARARAAAFALALAAGIALWLVSPRVFVEGSARAVLVTLGGVAGLATLIYLHGRFWRWRFCQDLLGAFKHPRTPGFCGGSTPA